MVERVCQCFQRLLAPSSFEFAFPHRDAMPAHLCELSLLLAVTLFVSFYLSLPKRHVGLGQAESSTVGVPMPEAAVDEDAGTVFAEHEVGVARQARTVQPVAKASVPQVLAHDALGLSSAGANGRHVVVSLRRFVHNF